MKRAICLLLTALLCAAPPLAAIAEGLGESQPISGACYAPEGATAETASYTLAYAYPQFEAKTDADEAINAYFRALGTDVAAMMADGELGELAHDGSAAYAEIGYEITRNDERYLSVLLSSRAMLGNAESETVSANTFARDGLYAGQPITLSQVLGLETQGDELEDGQSLAEKLAYQLVWQIVERASQNADADYLDGLTQQSLMAAFSPESDFYLDADGNIVFFIQPGEIAGEIAGVLSYPFAPAELLSAVKQN